MPDAPVKLGAPVKFEARQGVGVLTLNRPDHGNRLDDPMLSGLEGAVRDLTRAGNLRAVLLRAEGPNFCFGGDVATFAAAGPDMPAALRAMTSRFHATLKMLASTPLPVVAAVQGCAAGGGFSLACGSDLVLASESTRFVFAYHNLGLSPDGGLTWWLPRRIGTARALEWALRNRTIEAEEALDAGLVNRVVADEALQDEAWRWAEELAAGPTQALAATKHLVLDSARRTYSEQLDVEADSMVQLAASPDAASGVAAFMAKSSARFSGR